jgi:Restriction alleviation protein Lar
MSKPKLKACPFCGAYAELIEIGNEATKSRSVEIKCSGCFVKMRHSAFRKSMEWLVEIASSKWNARA